MYSTVIPFTVMCHTPMHHTPMYSHVPYSNVSHSHVSPCSLLPCTILPCTILLCTIFPFIILPCTILPCNILSCAVLPCTLLLCTAYHVHDTTANLFAKEYRRLTVMGHYGVITFSWVICIGSFHIWCQTEDMLNISKYKRNDKILRLWQNFVESVHWSSSSYSIKISREL